MSDTRNAGATGSIVRVSASRSDRLRRLLLSSVALTGTLLIGAARGAYAAENGGCSPTAASVTCAPANGDYVFYENDGVTSLTIQNGFDASFDTTAVTLINNGAPVTVTIQGDAQGDPIVVSGDNVGGNQDLYGVYASGAGGTTVNSDGDIRVTGGNGLIGTFADDVVGIGAFDSKGGVVTVRNTGDIIATGGDGASGATNFSYGGSAYGIYASNSTGDVSVTNSGDITATGGRYNQTGGRAYARGIIAETGDGSATIDNSGDIVVNADYDYDSAGLYASASNGDAVVINRAGADITVNGGGDGIIAYGYYGNARVENAGDITINQTETTLRGRGIYAYAKAGDVSVINTGDINVGLGSVAGTVDSDVQGGIYGWGVNYNGTAGNVSIRNSGDITVVGQNSASTEEPGQVFGIVGTSDGADVTIVNDGTINVTANPFDLDAFPQASGINATAYSGGEGGVIPGGDVSVVTRGDVTLTAGRQPSLSGSNPATTNAAIIVGSRASAGFEYGYAGTTYVAVDGAVVTANGDYVHGVFASGDTNTVVLKNGASVRATGEGAYGILVSPQVALGLQPSGVFLKPAPLPTTAIASSVNRIVVGEGSSVVSEESTAIVDYDTFTFKTSVSCVGPFVPLEPLRVIDAVGTPTGGNLTVYTVPNNTTVEVAGTVSGDEYAIRLNGGDDKVVIQPGYDIEGYVDGGNTNEVDGDVLALGGAGGSDTFDFSLVDGNGSPDGDDRYLGFDRFQKEGGSTFTVYGVNEEIEELPVLGGKLYVGAPDLPEAALPNAFISVSSGATLGGNGTIGSFLIQDGGHLAPGNSIGTLTVLGNATFADGSIYDVELDLAGPVDRIEVGGQTTIEGGTIAVDVTSGFPFQTAGLSPLTRYTIINSPNGRTGEFDQVTDNLPDVDFTDYYDVPGQVQLGFTQGTAGSGGLSDKGNAGAAALAAGDASLLFVESLVKRMDAAPGGDTTATASMAPMGYAQTNGLALRGTHNADMVAPMPVEAGGLAVFLGAMGESQDIGDDGLARGYDADIGGVLGGVEYTMVNGASTTRVGIAGGYSRTDVDVLNGSADVDSGHVGLFAGYQNGPLQLAGAVAYQFSNSDLERRIGFGGGAFTASADDVDGSAFSGFGEVYYDVAQTFGMTGYSLGPVARLRGFSATRDGYTETGAGLLNLSVGEQDVDRLYGDIGLRVSGQMMAGSMLITPQVELRYEHAFSDDTETSFAAIPIAGASFATPVTTGGDAFGLGLNVGMQFSSALSAQIRYDGSFGDDVQTHRGSATLSYKF